MVSTAPLLHHHWAGGKESEPAGRTGTSLRVFIILKFLHRLCRRLGAIPSETERSSWSEYRLLELSRRLRPSTPSVNTWW